MIGNEVTVTVEARKEEVIGLRLSESDCTVEVEDS